MYEYENYDLLYLDQAIEKITDAISEMNVNNRKRSEVAEELLDMAIRLIRQSYELLEEDEEA